MRTFDLGWYTLVIISSKSRNPYPFSPERMDAVTHSRGSPIPIHIFDFLKGYPGAETLMKLIIVGEKNEISSVDHFFGRGRVGELLANHVEVIFFDAVSSYVAVMISSLRRHYVQGVS